MFVRDVCVIMKTVASDVLHVRTCFWSDRFHLVFANFSPWKHVAAHQTDAHFLTVFCLFFPFCCWQVGSCCVLLHFCFTFLIWFLSFYWQRFVNEPELVSSTAYLICLLPQMWVRAASCSASQTNPSPVSFFFSSAESTDLSWLICNVTKPFQKCEELNEARQIRIKFETKTFWIPPLWWYCAVRRRLEPSSGCTDLPSSATKPSSLHKLTDLEAFYVNVWTKKHQIYVFPANSDHLLIIFKSVQIVF